MSLIYQSIILPRSSLLLSHLSPETNQLLRSYRLLSLATEMRGDDRQTDDDDDHHSDNDNIDDDIDDSVTTMTKK